MSTRDERRAEIGLLPGLRPRALAKVLLVLVHMVLLTLIGTGTLSAAVEGRAQGGRPHLPSLGIVASTQVAPPSAACRSAAIVGVRPPECAVASACDRTEQGRAFDRVHAWSAMPRATDSGPPSPESCRASWGRPWRDYADPRLCCHRTVVLHL